MRWLLAFGSLLVGGGLAALTAWRGLGPPDTLTGVANAEAFAPYGQTLASASADDTIRLWRVADRHRQSDFGRPVG